jgi:hypothetical protein
VVVSESGVKFLPKTLKPKICKQIKTTPNWSTQNHITTWCNVQFSQSPL